MGDMSKKEFAMYYFGLTTAIFCLLQLPQVRGDQFLILGPAGVLQKPILPSSIGGSLVTDTPGVRGSVMQCTQIHVPAGSQTYNISTVGIYISRFDSGQNQIRIALYSNNLNNLPDTLIGYTDKVTAVSGVPMEIPLLENAFGVSGDVTWACLVNGPSNIQHVYPYRNVVPGAGWYQSGHSVDNIPPVSLGATINSPPLQAVTHMWTSGIAIRTYTPTPTTTVSRTKTPEASDTPTRSATASYTRTPTALHTLTITPTPTPVPTYDPTLTPSLGSQDFSGIPAPEETRAPAMVDYSPTTVVAGESVELHFTGQRVGSFLQDLDTLRSKGVFDVKIARSTIYGDCHGNAPGTEGFSRLMVSARVGFKVTLPGEYRVCIRTKADWEPMPTPLTVDALDTTPTALATRWGQRFLGFHSCGGIVGTNETICGCYLGSIGVPSQAVSLPIHTPVASLFNQFSSIAPLPDSDPGYATQLRGANFGCCTDSSTSRHSLTTGGHEWGYCRLTE